MYDISALTITPKENPEWFTRALFGGRLVKNGYISIVTGVKGEERLKQLALNGKILQADGGDCSWSPQQLLKLSEKIAKVKTYKINFEQCIDELENKRTLYELTPGAANEQLPDEIEKATLFIIAVELSNEIEELIITGDSATDEDEIDGIYTQLRKSAETIKITGAEITKANAADAFEEVYAAIPEEVLQGEEQGTLFIMCSYAVRRILRLAVADKPNASQIMGPVFTLDDTDKRNPRLYYLGVEVVAVKGLDNSTLIAYDSQNIKMLTDMLGDTEQIEIGNKAKPEENTVFIKGRLRIGIAVLFDDEVVLRSAAPKE